MKKIFTVLMTCASALVSIAQSGSYQKTIGLGGDDYANVSVAGDSGSHFIAGSTTATGGGSYDAFIAKLDADGNFVWGKQYGGTGSEFGTSIINTQDGGFLLTGRSNSYSSSQDILVVKTDVTGTVIWAKTIGTDSVDYGLKAAEGPTGYLVVGQTKGSVNSQRNEIPLIMLSNSGALLWSKSLGSQFGNEVAYDVFSIGNDGWVIGGYTGINNIGLNDAVFFIVDTAGNLQASFEVGGTGDDDARRIVATNDAAYLVGNTRSFGVGVQDIFVAKYDVSGGLPSLSWFKTYGGTSSESITSAAFTPDGMLIVTALTTSFGQGDNGLVMALDTAGNVLISKTVGSAGNDVIMGFEVSNNPLLVGYSNSFNGGANNDLYLVRPDENAGMGCHAADVTLTVVTQSASVLGPSIADFSINTLTVTETSPSNFTNTNVGVDSSLCDTVNVSVKEVNGFSEVSLFPNPSNNNMSVSFYNETSDKVTYTITNLYGAVIGVIEKEIVAGSVVERVDVSSYAAGAYMLQISKESYAVSKRFNVIR